MALLPDPWLRALDVPAFDARSVRLHDFRRVGPAGPGVQAALVVAAWVATLALTHREYRQSGTAFGFPGPAIYMLFAPIVEELVFRGFVLGQLLRHVSVARAVVLSAALFGLLHARNVYWLAPTDLARSIVYTAALGLLLGYVTVRTRTLWPAVLIHYANNLAYYA